MAAYRIRDLIRFYAVFGAAMFAFAFAILCFDNSARDIRQRVECEQKAQRGEVKMQECRR